MARYARVENGVVIELIETGDYAISQLFAPSFVESMVQMQEGTTVEVGAPLSEARQAIEPLTVQQTPVTAQVAVVAEQEPAASDRTWRDTSLSATEWWVTRHRDEQELGRGTSLKAAQFLELLEYRQALRDWPESSQYPAPASRPSTPTWIAFRAGEK